MRCSPDGALGYLPEERAARNRFVIGGPTGTKFLSLVCHTESKTRVPLTLAVVAARHPLLDGHTHQVLLCVPVKELMRSGKHSERERYLQFIPDFSVFHCGASVARVKC